jgi:surface protein
MIKRIKDTINIRVKNNTSLPQNVNLLGGTSDPLAIPPSLLYQWDLSSESFFGSVTASIVISSTLNPTPVTHTVQVNGYNIQSVVFALNTLNLGVFQYSGNIIYVSSDFYIYGNLTINSTAFISTWDTTITSGSSTASNQIQLPLINGGTYNFVVDWGDGTQDTITSWNQAETLHTYASSGIYTLAIEGTILEWSFFESILDFGVSDSVKLTSISSWGSLQFGVLANGNFNGCINLDLTSVLDLPNLSNTITLDNCFSDCYSLTSINRSNEWDTSNINIMIATFNNSYNFNSNISSWNTSNVTDMNGMFQDATSFNQNLDWNVSNVQDMNDMFRNATSFNQNIGSWNIINVLDFTGFMTGKTDLDYSSANLDDIYNGWSFLSVQPNITIDFGTIKYTASAIAGRLILTSAPNTWIISDGGI